MQLQCGHFIGWRGDNPPMGNCQLVKSTYRIEPYKSFETDGPKLAEST
jgi:hypothetical protein